MGAERGLVLLAGGSSSRIGVEKGLISLGGKPIIRYVFNRVKGLIDRAVVAVSSDEQLEAYRRALPEADVVKDEGSLSSPLVGAITGFEAVGCEYALLLPCDTPFVSKDVASLLLSLVPGRDAVIPRWPGGRIEPIQAAYDTQRALKAAKPALHSGRMDLRGMVEGLRGVLYVSTSCLEALDPQLHTFLNINSAVELERARRILREVGKNGGED